MMNRVWKQSRIDSWRMPLVSRLMRWLRAHHADPALDVYLRPRDVVGQSIIADGLYERAYLMGLMTLMSPANRRLVLDIGANIGNHSLFFARHFDRVIAFEPNPVVNLVLQANCLHAGAANVEVVDVALSDRNGSARFVEPFANSGGASLLGTAQAGASREWEVTTARGDDFLRGRKGPVALVKVDVEGAEALVLTGMIDVLARDHPLVVFESHSRAEAQKVAEILDGVGYRHYYAIDRRDAGPMAGLLRRIVRRLALGADTCLTPLANFENRHYHMIVATTDPLEPGPHATARGANVRAGRAATA
jgi:FkbM family methyltransferase